MKSFYSYRPQKNKASNEGFLSYALTIGHNLSQCKNPLESFSMNDTRCLSLLSSSNGEMIRIFKGGVRRKGPSYGPFGILSKWAQNLEKLGTLPRLIVNVCL